MDRIRIGGGRPLNGKIAISGAKNATLPLMIASLLSRKTLTLTNVPNLADVNTLSRILGNHGVDVTIAGKRAGENPDHGRTLRLDAADIVDTTAPYDLVSRMRASFWVLGPLLGRCHEARVSLPGGCAIGTRPVDLFLEGCRALGAEVELDGGYVVASAKGGLKGADYAFPKVSVGATHTLMMAATLARGRTRLINAACEPEVSDVAACLNKMGAQISGIGTPELVIDGVDELHGATHAVLPDRIETGTYAMAVAATGGDVVLTGTRAGLLESVIEVIRSTGTKVESTSDGLHISRNGGTLGPVEVSTAPYPAFPTDMQAQLMALMTLAEGDSRITETIFENRFMHVQELARLGADIALDGETATVHGGHELNGAEVMATDLRASVSLVIAGLAASGETIINRVYHLDRGFERLEQKLAACGADIERLTS
jgi:UDP-N-acetylglucosamine 1-carboxyvinyltransferase